MIWISWLIYYLQTWFIHSNLCGCIRIWMCTYIYTYQCIYLVLLSSLLCIEVLVFRRNSASGRRRPFASQDFLSCIRAFVSAAVLTRAGAVFLWMASKYKVSTFLETIGISTGKVASGPILLLLWKWWIGCLRLQTCQFTLHLVEISCSHSYIIYINIHINIIYVKLQSHIHEITKSSCNVMQTSFKLWAIFLSKYSVSTRFAWTVTPASLWSNNTLPHICKNICEISAVIHPY